MRNAVQSGIAGFLIGGAVSNRMTQFDIRMPRPSDYLDIFSEEETIYIATEFRTDAPIEVVKLGIATQGAYFDSSQYLYIGSTMTYISGEPEIAYVYEAL
tara:strand:- start:97 stop:396 length:300 start_codon:yes stop_codon:yes gene_type:complete